MIIPLRGAKAVIREVDNTDNRNIGLVQVFQSHGRYLVSDMLPSGVPGLKRQHSASAARALPPGGPHSRGGLN